MMRKVPSWAVTALSSPRNSISSQTSPSFRCFHCSPKTWAIAHPITAHGPPPRAPKPAPEFGERVERRKKQEQSIQEGQNTNSQASQAKYPLKKRFWKYVNVKESPDGYQVLLDTRPVRSPMKTVITIPNSKRHLAEAIALEWDLLTSAQQALKHHLIPLTSLTTRATDIVREDGLGEGRIRKEIVTTAMRYLQTDTLLCWVPEKKLHDPDPVNGVLESDTAQQESLRTRQMKAAQEVIGFLTQTIWPGVEIKPVLDEDSIIPTSQSESTVNVIREWITALPPYEIAGLERAILASKSLLVAVRLIVEWGEHFGDVQPAQKTKAFGVDEAAEVSSLEVTYQTDMWGEVEDTHDVDREDLRRQLGSVILLISGDRR
ncbi:putative mitochondrial molecular chaperone [Talaromyces proteolyticus]|uniref:Mitochondrial molecular chaperone n=1 Tax=Talaromyces proteolyticus TaxID=1131652 RepID=A0AAD4KNL3_9EURO|nr:putative mitochondrial molecular chaperone [Talaromyces proteolyticus]KAH8692432.1 putative mitochondrial molecular chaperone [Talaromyces proteolyticus]